jgi:membrane associated rhomboid family serine protease
VRLPLKPVRVTYLLMILMAAVFLAQLYTQTVYGQDTIFQVVAKLNAAIAQGEIWRLVTALFAHVNLLHLLITLISLYSLGAEVERFYGGVRYGLLFLVSGAAGTVASLFTHPLPSAGAGGAIAGLFGAEIIFIWRNRHIFGERGQRGLQSLLLVFALNVVATLLIQIDFGWLIGGLLGGLAFGWFIGPVWQIVADEIPPEAASIGGTPTYACIDRQPLTVARWVEVVAFGLVLAALAGFAGPWQR